MVRLFLIVSGILTFVVTRISGFHPSARTFSRRLDLQATDPNLRESVGGLLGSALRRAQTTISEKNNNNNGLSQELVTKNEEANGLSSSSPVEEEESSIEETVGGLLQSAVSRAQSTLDETKQPQSPSDDSNVSNTNPSRQPPFKTPPPAIRPYHENPAITNTALAQSLWSTILRPNIDSAIDATCGNGHDSVALAKLLFADADDPIRRKDDCNSQLLCLDIQQQACDSTTAALAKEFWDDPEIMEQQYIQVLQTSHAPLPRPDDFSSVALVVYNLGYLPNADDKDCATKMESTLQSIADAMLMVRIGGMVSVVTYPKSNPEEDIAVRGLLECAALLSSNNQTWREFLDTIVEEDTTKEMIALCMERIEQQGNPRHTWRVAEHKRLGMDRAPILLTATRIK